MRPCYLYNESAYTGKMFSCNYLFRKSRTITNCNKNSDILLPAIIVMDIDPIR